jgi:hypothetical protein
MKRRELDPVYFGRRPWSRRVKDALARWQGADSAASFLAGHLAVIRQLLTHSESGPRMVVNIGADALLSFLRSGDYRNIYEEPVVGGKRRTPTGERRKVDAWLALPDPADFYFGAVALGGAGVRFYGEYCMVIRPSRVAADTRLFDRDSYDLLQPPFAGHGETRMSRIVAALRGRWDADLVDMLIMKMLPRLPATQHLITSGNVADLVTSDQEFVEVHLQGKIAPDHIEEIRQRPEEAAIEADILNRRQSRQAPTLVEIRWVAQRRKVLRRLASQALPYRLVTLHGKGYQWA